MGRYELELLGPRRVQVLRGQGSASLSGALLGVELPGGTVTPGLGALWGQNPFQLFPALPLRSVWFSPGRPEGHVACPYREGLGLVCHHVPVPSTAAGAQDTLVGDYAGDPALHQPALAPLCTGDQLPSGAWLRTWHMPSARWRQTLPFSQFRWAQHVSRPRIINPWLA